MAVLTRERISSERVGIGGRGKYLVNGLGEKRRQHLFVSRRAAITAGRDRSRAVLTDRLENKEKTRASRPGGRRRHAVSRRTRRAPVRVSGRDRRFRFKTVTERLPKTNGRQSRTAREHASRETRCVSHSPL